MTYLSDHAAGHNLPHHCEEGFPELLEKIVRESGWDLRNYKKASLKRRIAVRLNTHNISSYKDYHSVLESDPAEYNNLISTITIKVSEFFRDPEVFDLLREAIMKNPPTSPFFKGGLSNNIPPLAKGGQGGFEGDGLKAWSCGCAHGEEAYSLAILLAEFFGIGNLKEARVFATDADEKAIDKARKGTYTEESLRNISQNLKNRYFEKTDKGYKLNHEIRHLVRFGALDIIRGNPISKVDLLLCRNLLIYFEKGLQGLVLKKIDFALKPGGILVLGTAETLPPSFLSRYMEIKPGSRVYRKLR